MNEKIAVRSAMGTFLFSGLFVLHLMLVLSVTDVQPIARSQDIVLTTLGVNALSVAVCLLSGLCIVFSAYAKHYCKVPDF